MGDKIITLGCFGGWVLCAVGWVLNIAKFAMAMAAPLTGLEVFRAIGIVVVPIGCILGWL